MSYRIFIHHNDGRRDAMIESFEDLAEVCRRGLAIAEELGARSRPIVADDTLVEIVDEWDELQIAIGVIRPTDRKS